MDRLLRTLTTVAPSLQLETEVFERLIYKNNNQHRRGIYFKKLLEVRSSNRLLRHAMEQMTTAVRMRKLEASGGAGGGGGAHRQSLAERKRVDVAFMGNLDTLGDCIGEHLAILRKCSGVLMDVVRRSYFLPLMLTMAAICARFYTLYSELLSSIAECYAESWALFSLVNFDKDEVSHDGEILVERPRWLAEIEKSEESQTTKSGPSSQDSVSSREAPSSSADDGVLMPRFFSEFDERAPSSQSTSVDASSSSRAQSSTRGVVSKDVVSNEAAHAQPNSNPSSQTTRVLNDAGKSSSHNATATTLSDTSSSKSRSASSAGTHIPSSSPNSESTFEFLSQSASEARSSAASRSSKGSGKLVNLLRSKKAPPSASASGGKPKKKKKRKVAAAGGAADLSNLFSVLQGADSKKPRKKKRTT